MGWSQYDPRGGLCSRNILVPVGPGVSRCPCVPAEPCPCVPPPDINELNLPKTCEIDFSDQDDLLHFRLLICPDEGFYKGGKFVFSFKVSPVATVSSGVATVSSMVATNTSMVAINISSGVAVISSGVATISFMVATATSWVATSSSGVANNTSMVTTATSKVAIISSGVAAISSMVATNTSMVAINTSMVTTATSRVAINISCLGGHQHLWEDWKPVLTINSIIYGLQYLFLVAITTSMVAINTSMVATISSMVAINTSMVATTTSMLVTRGSVRREDWKPVLTINSIIYGLQYLFL
ncbi:putative LOC102089847, partial [Columba livia]